MLFKLSLVFPDAAPSRFKVALRKGSTRQLQSRLATGEMSDLEPSQAAEYLLSVMSQMNSHDRLTRGHSERVRAYTSLIAEELGLPEVDANKLQWASLLHDIGKLSVPEEILNSPTKPTDEEWTILRAHPGAAVALMAPLQEWLGDWALAASQHHERWDGQGYPAGLHGPEISLAGRIVAVADAYDVMTATRSYKKSLPVPVAKEELAMCAGSQFDPRIVRAFLRAGLDESKAVWAPLAWLGNLPGLAQIPAAASGAGTIVATTTVIATAAALQGPLAAAPPPAPAEAPIEYTIESVWIPTTIVVEPAPETEVPAESPDAEDLHATAPTGSTNSAPTTASTQDTTTTTTQPESTTTTEVTTSTTSKSGDSPTTSTTSRATTTTSSPSSTTTTTATTTTTTTTTTAPTTTTNQLVAPNAVGDSYSLNKKKDLKVLQNDSSGSSKFDKKTLAVIGGPGHGSTKIRKDKVQYKPDKDYVGPDAFTYRICNKDGLCDTARVSINVTD